MEQLEEEALRYGMLPFFANEIDGFSVEEMAAPGMLFGETNEDSGCWEWKGPVIREQTTAYGKFFNRKAGFVSVELLPDFLNYRRKEYPVPPGSTEAMLLDIIRENQGLTSTELRKIVSGTPAQKRRPEDLVEITEARKTKRHSLETPLQKLQMGGWLLIADFEYKYTAKGERYGWGVALYSTPETWFEKTFEVPRTPEESLDRLISHLSEKLPYADYKQIRHLIS
jgi:hypothetical protein